MKKEISTQKVYKKILVFSLSLIFLLFTFIIRNKSLSVIKPPFLIAILVVSILILLIFFYFYFTKRKISNEKQIYYFYQITELMQMIVLSLAIVQLIFSFLFFPATVEQTSMYPTLESGDKVFVKVGKKNLQRFDIIVINGDDYLKFNPYLDSEEPTLIIKRIVGLPGDNLYYKDGNLYLITDDGDIHINEDFLMIKETDDFNLQDILENGQTKIPDGYYFVLGDNRKSSNDSRHFGLVYIDDIIGKTNTRIKSFFKWESLKVGVYNGTMVSWSYGQGRKRN